MGFTEDSIDKFSSKNTNEVDLRKPNLFGVRHVQGILLFSGMVFGFFQRVNVSAAIVPMTKPQDNAPHYDWDSSTKSLILSAFFWGYILMQLPAGLLARRYGAKIVYVGAMIVGSVLTILCPLAAQIGNWQLLCATRVLIGLTQGVVYPCTHTLLSKWVPKSERSFMSTTVYSGSQLGTVISLSVSGPIFSSSMGWPGLFYITGACSMVWGIIFYFWGCNEPAQSKCITIQEKNYIETTDSNRDVPKVVPFKSILTSGAFYALMAAQSSYMWGFYTLLTEIPSYLSHALNLDMQSNSLLSALPYFCMWLFGFVVSPISDMLINKRILRVQSARKLFNTLGEWVPMIALIGLGFVTKENQVLAMALLTISVSINVCCYCGYLVNHMDLSPNFAGPLMGIANGVSSLCSIVAPLIVGAIVKDERDASQWRIVFFITAGVYLIGNGVFIIFGKATVQPWNSEANESSKTVAKTQPTE